MRCSRQRHERGRVGRRPGRRDGVGQYREKFPRIDAVLEVGALQQGAFSAEKVIALRPDVIVLTASGYRSAQEIGAIETMAQVGIITALVGVPVFVTLVFTRRRQMWS